MQFAQDWVVKKLIFHWLCKPCNCDLPDHYECARCSELPGMIEAFPDQHAYAVGVYEKYLAQYPEKAKNRGI